MTDNPTSVFPMIPALGARVQKAWDAAERDEKALPDIALDALKDFEPPEFRLEDVSRFILTTKTAQPARARVFSDMPINVHRGDGFYIEILIWVDGTTSIHQHSFSGAFLVLHGSSLHSAYRFEEARRINSRARLGRITCDGMEYLGRGDRRRITSGPGGLAHALFHLARPSVTLVIRTDNDPDAQPQLSLHPPRLAVDPRTTDRLDEPMRRWLRLLDAVGGRLEMDDPLVDRLFELDYGRFARFALAYPDFAAGLGARTPWQAALGTPGQGAERLAARFGEEAGDALLQAILEERRRDHVRRARAGITDPGLRFFLALLLNGRSRSHVFQALRDRRDRGTGPEPAQSCRDWVLALAEEAGEPANEDLLTRCPWLRELGEVMKPLEKAQAREAAELLMTDDRPGPDAPGGAEPAARAARKLAAIEPLRALTRS